MTNRDFHDPRATEQRNPRSERIDVASSLEIVDIMNAEDARVAGVVHGQREETARAIDLIVAAFKAGGRLVYVGAGTSGRLGVLDATECPPTFGVLPTMVTGVIAGGYGALVKSAEGAEDDVNAGAAAMDPGGASVINPVVGPEVVTGSTRLKAGTATKLVLNTLSTGAMIRLGKVFGNLMVDLMALSAKLHDRGERIVMEVGGVSREEARQAIERAKGSVKLAIVMVRRKVDAAEARRLLETADGFVRPVVGDPPPVGR